MEIGNMVTITESFIPYYREDEYGKIISISDYVTVEIYGTKEGTFRDRFEVSVPMEHLKIKMSRKDKIKNEIKIQKEIEGELCQEEILLAFLDVFKTHEEWRMFIDCKWHKYGKMSYESHRFYYPSQKLIDIVNVGKKFY